MRLLRFVISLVVIIVTATVAHRLLGGIDSDVTRYALTLIITVAVLGIVSRLLPGPPRTQRRR